jgi:hypothetical protein
MMFGIPLCLQSYNDDKKPHEAMKTGVNVAFLQL